MPRTGQAACCTSRAHLSHLPHAARAALRRLHLRRCTCALAHLRRVHLCSSATQRHVPHLPRNRWRLRSRPFLRRRQRLRRAPRRWRRHPAWNREIKPKRRLITAGRVFSLRGRRAAVRRLELSDRALHHPQARHGLRARNHRRQPDAAAAALFAAQTLSRGCASSDRRRAGSAFTWCSGSSDRCASSTTRTSPPVPPTATWRCLHADRRRQWPDRPLHLRPHPSRTLRAQAAAE